MAEDTPASADPSMEEILASIRKIISDDVPPPAEPAAESAPAGESLSVPEEDVVELTQMLQDDGSVVDLAAATAPPPAPEPAPLPPPPPSPPAPPVPPPPAAPAEPLVSAPAAETAASSLSNLASTVEIERLASVQPLTATYLGNGGRTLEDMVIELMRPLLKQWLDENLPAVVERLVQKEVERIARRN